MNRRNFLRGLIGGVAAAAAEQVIPLGRVWSFPSKIVIAKEEAYRTYLWGADALMSVPIGERKVIRFMTMPEVPQDVWKTIEGVDYQHGFSYIKIPWTPIENELRNV